MCDINVKNLLNNRTLFQALFSWKARINEEAEKTYRHFIKSINLSDLTLSRRNEVEDLLKMRKSVGLGLVTAVG